MRAREPLARLLQRLATELWEGCAVCNASEVGHVATRSLTAGGSQLRQIQHLAADAAPAAHPGHCGAVTKQLNSSSAAQHLHALCSGGYAASPPPLPLGALRQLHTSAPKHSKAQQKAKELLVDGKPARKPRSPRKTPKKAAMKAVCADPAAADSASIKGRRSANRSAADGAPAKQSPGGGKLSAGRTSAEQHRSTAVLAADGEVGLPPRLHVQQAAGEAESALQQVEPALGATADPQPGADFSAADRKRLLAITRKFVASADTQDQALALYVNSKLYTRAAASFRRGLMKRMTPEMRDALLASPNADAVQEVLFPDFARFALATYADEITAYRELVKTADLTKPHLWYPMARAMQRRIVYHAGPTNSGKTYQALQAMRAANEGVYLAPLRLLAMEVADTCNAGGTFCSLVTGQERKEVPGANHTACTIEMADLHRRIDVAVIDEVQMVGDEQRGWAWTRALQGLPAAELHLCGDASALPLVQQLCAETGEEVEVRRYDRFTPLQVEPGGLRGGYHHVQPGDAVVAFRRKDIFTIKQMIEATTGHKACVVYGALPPEMRRLQAQLFNDPDSEYKVLVASDAVGMGLNLNIRRIIFHSLLKFEGSASTLVSTGQLKQIAGRAGRRNSAWGGTGLATCRLGSDVKRLQAALDVPLDDMSTPHAGLFPEFEHLEVFAGQVPELSFPEVLARFGQEARLDGTYFLCQQEALLALAKALEQVKGLSLADRFTFAMSPTNHRSRESKAALLRCAAAYAAGRPSTLDLEFPDAVPATPDELQALEEAYKVVAMWMWLSQRFGEQMFPGREAVRATAQRMVQLMSQGLQELSEKAAAQQLGEQAAQKQLGKQKGQRRRRSSDQTTSAGSAGPTSVKAAAISNATADTPSQVQRQLLATAPQSAAAMSAAGTAAAMAVHQAASIADTREAAAREGVASLWQRVAGGMPAPKEPQQLRDQPTPRVLPWQAPLSAASPAGKSAAPRRYVLSDRHLALPLSVLRAGAVCTKVPAPYMQRCEADQLVAQAAQLAQPPAGKHAGSIRQPQPNKPHTELTGGTPAQREPAQSGWAGAAAASGGGGGAKRAARQPRDTTGDGSGEHDAMPWMPLPVRLPVPGGTSDWTPRLPVFGSSLWGRARQWLANA